MLMNDRICRAEGKPAVSSLSKYLRPFRLQFILGPTAKLIEAVIELYLPLLMARMIDLGVQQGRQEVIAESGVRMGILVIVGLLFSLTCQYMASLASQGVGTRIRDDLFARIMQMKTAEVERFGTGSLTNRLTVDVTRLQIGVAMSIRLLVRAPFLSIGGFVMACMINWRLSLILLAALPVSVIILFFVMKTTVKLFLAAQKRLDKLAELVQDNLSGARVIRAFHRQERERTFFSAKNQDWEAVVMKAGNIAAGVNPFTTLIFNLAVVGILYAGGIQIQAGSLTQGELIALVNYMTQIVTAMIVVANLIITLTNAVASGRRIAEVLSQPQETRRTAEASPASSEALLSCEAVDFYYPHATEAALRGIRFVLPKGGTLGVIGGTGAGKSTLAMLLAGLYEPTAGRVLLHGRPLDRLPQETVRLVFQKARLFSGTIASNLRIGAPAATDEELWTALRIAQADEFVALKEGGLDAVVERGGVNLSGGQRQRLALARSLVTRPDVLILDDSSSALDYITDARLHRALKDWAEGGTALIVISQRVHQVARMDRILVLDNGRPVGYGTHRDLLKTNALYREIYRSQQENVPQEEIG
jgi:ATP-binding cassette subfamily B multidrug efflux pump